MHKTSQFLDLNVLTISDATLEDIRAAEKEHESVVDLINILDPDDKVAESLAGLYLRRPLYVTYRMDLRDGSYKKRIKSKDRKLRKVDVGDFELVKEEQLTQASFDDFLELYKENMQSMDKGIVKIDESWFAEQGEKAAGIFLRKEDKLVAGILAKRFDDRFSVSYSAQDFKYKQNNVYKHLVFESMNFAKALGYDTYSYGQDSNLYGHHLSTGLYLFKKEMGLTPQAIVKKGSALTRIVNTDKFINPIFILTQADEGQLAGSLLFKDKVNVKQSRNFRADFLANLDVYRIRNGNLEIVDAS